ncbi:MAG: TetR/AcrR family transcriptional regulator [Hyphomicrobium sp.]
MGRRSVHTAEQLREVILDASIGILQEQGLQGLSAREIARRIDYSPGTLYNVFENLDDIVLTIEGRMLDGLAAVLEALPDEPDPRRDVRNLAHAYLAYSHEHPKLWNLLFEHHLPAGRDVPEWYKSKLDGLLARVESAVRPLQPQAGEDAVKRSARVLWAGVHGITSLSTADKLSNVTSDSAAPLIDDLVGLYLAGLEAQHKAQA